MTTASERSMRQSEAARVLGVKPRTVHGGVARGEKLEVDPEADSSRATFVTRASVAALQHRAETHPVTVPEGDVARRLGVGIKQVDRLVQHTCWPDRQQQVLADSLDSYIESHRPELLDR